jgi:ribonuclease P protein component
VLATTQRLRHASDFTTAMRGGRRVGRGSVVVHLVVPTAPNQAAPAQAAPAQAAPVEVGSVQVSPVQSFVEPAPAGSIVSPARAGFVVSKAVGKAVVRNKVRRRLRHLVRDRIAALPPGAMLVVRALPSAATAPASVLATDLDAALAAASAPRRPRSSGERSR